MSDSQRQHAQSGTTLLVAGILCTFFGLFMYGLRLGFAEFFFNARFLFGIPLTNADAFKVLLITISSGLTTLVGIVLLGVALSLFLKVQPASSQGSAAAQ